MTGSDSSPILRLKAAWANAGTKLLRSFQPSCLPGPCSRGRPRTPCHLGEVLPALDLLAELERPVVRLDLLVLGGAPVHPDQDVPDADLLPLGVGALVGVVVGGNLLAVGLLPGGHLGRGGRLDLPGVGGGVELDQGEADRVPVSLEPGPELVVRDLRGVGHQPEQAPGGEAAAESGLVVRGRLPGVALEHLGVGLGVELAVLLEARVLANGLEEVGVGHGDPVCLRGLLQQLGGDELVQHAAGDPELSGQGLRDVPAPHPERLEPLG